MMTDGRRAFALAHAQAQRERWALAKQEADEQLLTLRDVEKLTYARLATRIGISRQAARYRVGAARRREATRQGMSAKV